MNPLQHDIINTIRTHGASRTTDICEHLLPLGYGGAMSFDDFKSHITKTISKMKAEGHVIGEDRPTPGSKPVRYWSLPESHEMASDVVEAEQAPEILAPDYEPSSVAFVLHKKPMSAAKILKEFANCAFEDDGPLGAFLDGIAAAERFHGIAE